VEQTKACERQTWADYGFAVTLVWIGFVLSISVLETPLRFRAEGITLPMALRIGKLVFHGLNVCEILFAAVSLLILYWGRPYVWTRRCLRLAVLVLATQTCVLFFALDPRTDAIIASQNTEESAWHSVYIILEVAKLTALTMLAWNQIADFRRHLVFHRPTNGANSI
jgi:hypothetical protein